ncbi:MAG TPA: SRPBCC domain-containing protein [Acidobacteriaceae bacterium]|nr:SRPBCC domain-containing protein [Acidobacteriaceae bacterium]
MPVIVSEQVIHTLEFFKEEEIAAPIDIVFETILEEMEQLDGPGGVPLQLKLEPWPGGRWYRDLGNNAGHWWGAVQAIKPPSLLEISGPLFMSYPAISNVQYRLTEENGATRLKFAHRAMAYIAYDPQIGENWKKVESGWGPLLERIKAASVKK